MTNSTKQLDLPKVQGDLLLLRLAREIAMDQHDIDTILERNGVTHRDWARIQRMNNFQKYLAQELQAWNSAMNTTERVKIKASAMIEEWLPEAFKEMHNNHATLLHRTELAKFVGRLGGMDKGPMSGDAVGERFHVTINLGNDAQLKFDKQQTLPAKVIDGEKVE